MMLRVVLLVMLVACPGGSTVLRVLSNLSDDSIPDDLLKIAVNSCNALPVELLSMAVKDAKYVAIALFTRKSVKFYAVNDIRRLLLENPKLNSFRQTVLYVHGWRNTPLDESSQAIVRALLSKDVNVLVLDTSVYMRGLYVVARSHVFKIGEVLSRFLVKLSEKVPVKKIYLIGFSLGAHISGVAGRLFHRHTGKLLERITGLDPAKPCFERRDVHKLRRKDARFVDVIHTNSGTLGLRDPIGHVDVYVNGASGNQPGCQRMLIRMECDHAQAWRVFVKSTKRQMMALECRKWEELETEQCAGRQVRIGYGTQNSTRGIFFMRTGSTMGQMWDVRRRRNAFDVATMRVLS